MRWLHVAHIALLLLLVAGSGPVRHPRRITHAAQVHTLTVFLTGYDDRGYTASGTWAGPGTCASDWRVIPRGAYVHVPGIGDCRAWDRGGLINGARLDYWFPTAWQCYQATGWYRVTWRVQ